MLAIKDRLLVRRRTRVRITEDAGDPHFLANLNRLGPVSVNSPSQVVRTANVEKSRQLLESRIRADQEASSVVPVRNRISASTLSLLLDQRKSAKTSEDAEALGKKYGIDSAKFSVVSRCVNSPSIQLDSVLRAIGKDGEQNVTVLAVWIEPCHSS
ncbi:hypothetical protein L218DRAFT_208861 [Marasmius fiardii PR-910]|nr:hypothetical protein L218DRAFT_208861 [Marasmius fiardii PR-910]